jgi:hypothetical protein
LYGAADVDRDGRITYREIAAFVERANAAIPNERFRPRIFARPPKATEQLLDLRVGLDRRIEVPARAHGHYLLEDSQGVRLMDFHNGAEQSVELVHPVETGQLYLRSVRSQREYVLPSGETVLDVGQLVAQAPRTEVRGAAHDAFNLLFTLPFGPQAVAIFAYSEPDDLIISWSDEHWLTPRLRRGLGWTGMGLGGAALATGLGLTLSARKLRHDTTPATSNRAAVRRNERIASRNTAAVALYSVGTLSLAAGLWALLGKEESQMSGAALEISANAISGMFAF